MKTRLLLAFFAGMTVRGLIARSNMRALTENATELAAGIDILHKANVHMLNRVDPGTAEEVAQMLTDFRFEQITEQLT